MFDELFHSQSRARVMNLRFQLQTLKKGSLSINEYYLKMKSISDSLRAAGQELSDDDIAMYLLGGVGPEFDAVVVNLNTHITPPSISEVVSVLQMHEMRLL